MKKNLHLFRTSQFTKDFILFINRYFKSENHIFWVYGENFFDYSDKSMIQFTNVTYIPEISILLNKESINKRLHEFDLIFYHGLFDENIVNFFGENRHLVKKLCLYFWGGDKKPAACWRESSKENYRYLIHNAAKIITIIDEDYKGISDEYAPQGKHYTVVYGENYNYGEINFEDIVYGKVINIQIGNSAAKSNNHIRVFKELEKFQKENIRIWVPLSYGNKEYAKEVIDFGRNMFDSKFEALEEFMPEVQYNELLKTMDIGIFDIERQQALGNIISLLQSGSKVFLRKDTMLARYFEDECRCKVFYIEDIAQMGFKEFIQYTKEEALENSKKMDEFYDVNDIVEVWNKIFS